MVPVGRLVVLRAQTRRTSFGDPYLTWPALVALSSLRRSARALVTYAHGADLRSQSPAGLIALLVAVRIVPDLRPDRQQALTGGGSR